MKSLVLSSVAVVAAAAMAPSVAGAGSSFAPALVRPAPVRPAIVKPAPVRPALVRSALFKAAVAAEWCSDRPDGDCTLASPQAPSGSAKSASTQAKVVPRPATDPWGQPCWRSGHWYMCMA